jgi:hypothetical protein
MYETTRGIATLVGAAVAGFLIWLAVQVGDDTAGEFWATYGLVAAAGLTMALSQVLGGWTKWGWPRLSPGVFLLAFVPVAVVTLWLLFARQPGDPLLETGSWSGDLGIDGVVSNLGELLAAVAFGAGLVLGFTFDTAGPTLRREPGYPVGEQRFGDRPDPAYVDRGAADEPLTAERRSDADTVEEVDAEGERPPRRVIRP